MQCARGRVSQDAKSREIRSRLLEQLQAFCSEIGKIQKHARYVASRASETFDPSASYRIALKVNRDYRNVRSGVLRCLNGRRTNSHNGTHTVVDQIRCKGRQAG